MPANRCNPCLLEELSDPAVTDWLEFVLYALSAKRENPWASDRWRCAQWGRS